MVYFGKVQNGAIIPEGGVRVPEGSRVRIEPVTPSPPAQAPDPADDPAAEAVDFGSTPSSRRSASRSSRAIG